MRKLSILKCYQYYFYFQNIRKYAIFYGLWKSLISKIFINSLKFLKSRIHDRYLPVGVRSIIFESEEVIKWQKRKST